MASVSVSVVYACFECGYDEPEETLHASNHVFFCVKHVSSQRCGGRYECSIMHLFDLNKKSSFSRKIRQYLTANAYCFVEKFGKKQFLVACGGYLR